MDAYRSTQMRDTPPQSPAVSPAKAARNFLPGAGRLSQSALDVIADDLAGEEEGADASMEEAGAGDDSFHGSDVTGDV